MIHSEIDRFGQKNIYILRKHLAKKTTKLNFHRVCILFFNRQQVDCGSSSVQDFTNRKQNHESLIHSNFVQFVLFFQLVCVQFPTKRNEKNKTTKKNN